MIYTTEASFPYPIISYSSNDYLDNTFFIDVEIKSNSEYYSLFFNINLNSKYLKKLLEENLIEYYVIIKTQDSSFYKLSSTNQLDIEKRKLSFKNNSKIQLILKSNSTLNFKDNFDIDPFYTEDNSNIIIEKNSIIGFSNVVIFENSKKSSVDLFEKKIDKNITSDIKIEIRDENIVLFFKSEDYQYNKLTESKRLNYPYIYMGLQKLLMEMIATISKNSDNILEIGNDSLAKANKGVYIKIINLLANKNIKEISFENIDHVINLISPNIIDGYYKGVMEVCKNEN